MSIRIVLADDHQLMRSGLAALLRKDADFELVGEVGDGMNAVKMVRQLEPDILVIDLSMPGMNGIEAISRIQSEMPAVKCICLSVHYESRMVLAALDAGATGYVLKDSSFDELAQAIRRVLANQTYLSPALVGLVVQKYRHRHRVEAVDNPSALTKRERELVQLLSEGYSTSEIASRLSVSIKTVATHRQNILQKLGIGGIAELTRYALREGLTSLDGTPPSR
ncbi:MAG: response regulator [Burkholderiales bacterium]|jgi:DNA-binding NarL/FixJ family response regulator